MTKKKEFNLATATIGDKVRAKRHEFLVQGIGPYVAWFAEIKIDGRWTLCVDKTTKSGLVEGRTVRDTRKKAIEAREDFIRKQEEARRGR